MPQADPIVRADRVRLVDDKFSTEKRERVAEYIDEHWNEARDITLTDIAEDTETSRQHVANVLKDHFEIDDEQTVATNQSGQDQAVIPAREEVDPKLLQKVLTAYRIGCRDASSEEIERGISDELLSLATRE